MVNEGDFWVFWLNLFIVAVPFFLVLVLLFGLQLALLMLTEDCFFHWNSLMSCLSGGLRILLVKISHFKSLDFWSVHKVCALTPSGDQVSSPVLCSTSKMTSANTYTEN